MASTESKSIVLIFFRVISVDIGLAPACVILKSRSRIIARAIILLLLTNPTVFLIIPLPCHIRRYRPCSSVCNPQESEQDNCSRNNPSSSYESNRIPHHTCCQTWGPKQNLTELLASTPQEWS